MILSEASKEYEFSEDEINTVSNRWPAPILRMDRPDSPYSLFSFRNQIDINEKNTFLCTADDLGEVKVIDLESHKLYKQFRSKHKNVSFSAYLLEHNSCLPYKQHCKVMHGCLLQSQKALGTLVRRHG